jgi:hypothetical protein
VGAFYAAVLGSESIVTAKFRLNFLNIAQIVEARLLREINNFLLLLNFVV